MTYNSDMILGVMSDSHGNHGLLHRVARRMQESYQVELIIHLGDDYRDAALLEMTGYSVCGVPGLWCPEYGDGRTPKHLSLDVCGIRVGGAHAEKDLRAIDRNAGIVLLGHTHKACVERLGRTLYVNPGHLKGDASRGEPPSFAVIRIEDSTVEVRLVDARTDSELQRLAVNRDDLA